MEIIKRVPLSASLVRFEAGYFPSAPLIESTPREKGRTRGPDSEGASSADVPVSGGAK
jgi:hypothetical protein